MRTLILKTKDGATVYRLNENTYTVGKPGDYPKVMEAIKKDLQSPNFVDRLQAQTLLQDLENNTLITLEN